MSDEEDRRSGHRYGFRVPAHIYVGENRILYKGYVMNLSDAGAFVMMEQIKVGPRIWIEFSLPRNLDCQAFGQINRVMNMGTQQGLGCDLTHRNDAWNHFLDKVAMSSAADILLLTHDIGRITVYTDG